MKKIFNRISIIIGSCILILYIIPKNPVGTYTANNNKYTSDTIFIKKDSTYERVIYCRFYRTPMFVNNGKWEYENGRLTLYDFYPDEDECMKAGYHFNSALWVFSVPLERSFGRIVFDFDEEKERYRYFKKFFNN